MNAPTILVVEDSDLQREHMVRTLTAAGYEVVSAATVADGLALIETHVIELAFLDLNFGHEGDGAGGRMLLSALRLAAPDVPAIIVTADNTAGSAVDLLRRGALHYLPKPVDADELVRQAEYGLELSMARRSLALLQTQEHLASQWDVGETARMKNVAALVDKFAPSDAGILIQGESGTGKDLVARTIHEHSRRAKGPFIAINCAAIPKDLLESQLFGHEKGSFTGALTMRRGLIEQAHRGTLFLDEVTMMPLEMQAKLLRVLQDFRIRRVGGEKEIQVDVRVLCASNQDIAESIKAGAFRDDLYYRLCIMRIELPPLRARVADIPYLAEKFLLQLNEQMGTTVTGFTEAAMWVLCHYPWPGNIRELHNVVERALILATGATRIDVNHLPELVGALPPGSGTPGRGGAAETNGHAGLPPTLPSEGMDLKGVASRWEYQLVRQALARTDHNQTAAAKLLGLSRDELRYRLEKYGPGEG